MVKKMLWRHIGLLRLPEKKVIMPMKWLKVKRFHQHSERVRIFQFQVIFSLCFSVPGISITSAHDMILTICIGWNCVEPTCLWSFLKRSQSMWLDHLEIAISSSAFVGLALFLYIWLPLMVWLSCSQ